jgi:hypothetical protein
MHQTPASIVSLGACAFQSPNAPAPGLDRRDRFRAPQWTGAIIAPMRRAFAVTAAVAVLALVLRAAERGVPIARPVREGVQQTWKGQISDNLCGAKHEEAAEGQGRMPDRACTLACVRGGSKFALVVDGKLFQIANQDLPDLKTHAGHTVLVTGELNDHTITVSKIVMP